MRDEPIVVTARPVVLFSSDPERTRLGRLRFLGGWSLTASSSQFGGISSLRVDADLLTGLTDAGGIAQFRINRFGHISDAHLFPIPAGCGSGGDKADRDSESLADDPVTGKWWIGLEWKNAICRASADLRVGEAQLRPRPMANWPRYGGPETLLRLADGRFVVIAERAPGAATARPLLVFNGDPADARTPYAALSYLPPDGFSPTDAAQLPDGRILILNRRFALGSLFTAVVTIVDANALKPGATVSGGLIARLESPALAENFEGIAISTEDDQTVVWLISDDNFASWQRTLLLKFALDEGPQAASAAP